MSDDSGRDELFRAFYLEVNTSKTFAPEVPFTTVGVDGTVVFFDENGNDLTFTTRFTGESPQATTHKIEIYS